MKPSVAPTPESSRASAGPDRQRSGRLRFYLGMVRLWTGLLLAAFVVTHFLNHALGLISLDAMEAGRHVFLGFWRLDPIYLLLMLALLVHPALALHRLWRRRSLRMSPSEAAQLLLGLSIPGLLALHVLGTTVMNACCELRDTYAYELDMLWPGNMVQQTTLMAVVWLHGLIGVRNWLSLKPGFDRFRTWFASLAVLLPVLAFLGAVSAGRELARLKEDDSTAGGRLIPFDQLPGADVRWFWVYELEWWITWGFAAVVVALLLARAVRARLAARRSIAIHYDDGLLARVPRGLTVLEASRVAGIPHAAVCGGRGRCSTCRVRIIQGPDLPPPDEAERRVLERIAAEPDVRLACRLQPSGDIRLARLTPVGGHASGPLRRMDPAAGREREIAVLFADLRGFTSLAEQRLPYDTVYLLNRYFAAMGAVIEQAGGRLDKFIGDGIMALFGLEGSTSEAARQALRACAAMSARLETLNAELAGELPQPLRIGMGLHLGRAIVGEMGWGRAVGLTAIGDPVNVASRLEQLTKEHAVELLVSAQVLRRAGLAQGLFPLREVELRGRDGRLSVAALDRAQPLAELPGLSLPPRQGSRSRLASVRAIVRSWSRRG